MTTFSAEYRAQIEEGMKMVTATSQSLDAAEQLLDREPTAAATKEMVQHLGLCSSSVCECEEFHAIMPHDSDELRSRFMTLAQRAGRWANPS